MNLKSLFTAVAIGATFISGYAQDSSENIIILDLSQSTTSLSFDEVNGMWNDTYNEDETEIESQVFSIEHGAIEEWNYWWGFTASNSAENTYKSNTLLYQYSNMAKGGILLNEEGSIKLNNFGAPVSSREMPYLVGFPKSVITFNTGKAYEPVGAYFNLNTYTFYSILYGDGFARAFTEGDTLTLTVHGVDSDENETKVDVILASFANGSLTAATGWKYVDLSALGTVEEIYFTMSSTDSGEWGMNTPGYFCLDKLMVKEGRESSVLATKSIENKNAIIYDRNAKTINLGNETFAIVYDHAGRVVMSCSDSNSFSIEHLEPGIYLVKSGNNHLKFTR